MAATDRLEGRAVSPLAFRTFGIEAMVLGRSAPQAGLLRREGVALWRRVPEHAPVFDRFAGEAGADSLVVRVVVATTRLRDRALRVPALGERAARALAAAAAPPPATPWLLLVDEGPGETWLYLAEEGDAARALGGFLGRRGRTDFALAQRRASTTRLAALGLLAGLALAVYGPALGAGAAGQALGALLLLASLAALALARAR